MRETMYEILVRISPKEKQVERLFRKNNLDKTFIKPSSRRVGFTTYRILCMITAFIFHKDFKRINFKITLGEEFEKGNPILEYICRDFKSLQKEKARFIEFLQGYYGRRFEKLFIVGNDFIERKDWRDKE